jgi:hypothetical protein
MQLAVATAANISTPAWEASSWTHGYHAVLYAAPARQSRAAATAAKSAKLVRTRNVTIGLLHEVKRQSLPFHHNSYY